MVVTPSDLVLADVGQISEQCCGYTPLERYRVICSDVKCRADYSCQAYWWVHTISTAVLYLVKQKDQLIVSSEKMQVDIGDPDVSVTGMDCIWHNMYLGSSDGALTTFRKWFQDDANMMVARIAKHVSDGLYEIISVTVSKRSAVVICATEKSFEDMPEGSFVG